MTGVIASWYMSLLTAPTYVKRDGYIAKTRFHPRQLSIERLASSRYLPRRVAETQIGICEPVAFCVIAKSYDRYV